MSSASLVGFVGFKEGKTIKGEGKTGEGKRWLEMARDGRAPRSSFQVDIDLVKLEAQVMAEGSDEETETHTPSESVKETE